MVSSAAAAAVAGALLVATAVSAVNVLRYTVPFESEQTITVDGTIEYIFEFDPTAEQAAWPARIRLTADAGDVARPVLLTARQTTGAQTWQLPYIAAEGDEQLYELQRTLCFRVSENGGGSNTERFTLHVSSANNASVTVTARVDPARDWMLNFGATKNVRVTQMSSRVYYYSFSAEQQDVRLVVASEDDVCSVVAIRDYSCPVAETQQAVTRPADGMFMTVERSGGAQISRSEFPRGFFVSVVVLSSDEPCAGEQPRAAHWLYQAAAVGRDGLTTTATTTPAPPERAKTLTIDLKPALSRTQYVVACAVTILIFLLFYVSFFLLVFAQRFQPVKRAVAPKAVLAASNNAADAAEGRLSPNTERMRRRGSNDTLDSLSNDSESEQECQPRVRDVSHCAADNGAYSESVTNVTNVTNDNNVTNVTNDNNVTNGTAPSDGAVAAAGDNVTANGSEEQHQQANGQQVDNRARAESAVTSPAPFNLPQRLNVAALSRLTERTLSARSDRYLHTLYTVSVFYALPVIQFVFTFQLILNVSGSLDLCYYNFLCAHPWGGVSDFNHVFSNLGYLLLGALFMLQVRRRRMRRKRKPRHEQYGIPAHYGLLTALGASMMVVALLSATYHICPNRLNFQFDTAFMYVLAVLSMVKMYQSRHPDINARAHATFAALAVLIAMVVWGVVGGGALFWGVFTMLHVFTFLLLSLRIYYVGQFRLDQAGLRVAARGLRELPQSRPLYASRLVALWLANAVNWSFAIYGLYAMPANFASHLLFILLGNTLLYMLFYLGMKLAHGERLRWYAWCFLCGAAAAWAPAMWLFVRGSSSWAATPARSRHLNHECRALRFYDAHDLWHMLSALALFLSFNALLTWDDGLSAVKRTDIAVF